MVPQGGIDGVSGRTGLGRDHASFGPEQAVDEAGLADVWSSHYCNLDLALPLLIRPGR